MSNDDASKKVKNFTKNAEKIILAVLKNSIQEVIIEAQRPLRDGGKMHVDTGFLRHSGTASLNELPKGLIEGRERNEGEVGVLPEYNISDESSPGSFIHDVLARMTANDTFYFGWTAHYAQYRELYDGFLASASKKWSKIVENQIRRIIK